MTVQQPANPAATEHEKAQEKQKEHEGAAEEMRVLREETRPRNSTTGPKARRGPSLIYGLFVAVAFKPRPVAIYRSGLTVDGGVAPVETSFLFVLTGRPGPRRPIMPVAVVIVIVGCLVVPHIEALFLVGAHAASFH